jgi:hypothetical protein
MFIPKTIKRKNMFDSLLTKTKKEGIFAGETEADGDIATSDEAELPRQLFELTADTVRQFRCLFAFSLKCALLTVCSVERWQQTRTDFSIGSKWRASNHSGNDEAREEEGAALTILSQG